MSLGHLQSSGVSATRFSVTWTKEGRWFVMWKKWICMCVSTALAAGLFTFPEASSSAQDKKKAGDVVVINIVGDGPAAKYIEEGKAKQEPVMVVVGQKVRWNNQGDRKHTARHKPANATDPRLFDTGQIKKGEASKDILLDEALFKKAGGGPATPEVKLEYECENHPAQMFSTITLKAAGKGQNASADDTDGMRVTVLARPSEKLARELNALVHAGGELEGRAPNGGAVIRVGDVQQLKKMAASPAIINVQPGPPADVQRIDRLVVMYKPDAPITSETLKKRGFEVVEHNQQGNFFVVTPVKKNGIQANAVMGLVADQSVRFIEPVYRFRIPPRPAKKEGINKVAVVPAKKEQAAKGPVIPNDKMWDLLWGMRMIRAPQAWSKVKESPVIVAVIDSGVDYSHPDLKPNMWVNPLEIAGDGIDNDGNGIVDDIHGADFVGNGKGKGDPMDENSHGTHCAGTIGAVGNDGIGVVGVNWKVKIMGLRFLDAAGFGDTPDAIECIDYAVKNGAKVLSNSWGGGGFSQALKEAIERAEKSGALFIAAAGNCDLAGNSVDNDTEPHYPSSYDNKSIIAVLAVNSDDTLAAFLNVPASFSNFGKQSVHIGAPGGRNTGLGVYIMSSIPKSLDNATAQGGYWDGTVDGYVGYPGTSMATPHVAGAAALIWAHPTHAKATASQVKDLILKNARLTKQLDGKCVTGGVLDLGFMGQ
jgi:subtilisin family serine protease